MLLPPQKKNDDSFNTFFPPPREWYKGIFCVFIVSDTETRIGANLKKHDVASLRSSRYIGNGVSEGHRSVGTSIVQYCVESAIPRTCGTDKLV